MLPLDVESEWSLSHHRKWLKGDWHDLSWGEFWSYEDHDLSRFPFESNRDMFLSLVGLSFICISFLFFWTLKACISNYLCKD
ncbi:hypothetical protein MANES_18G074601v8 [Manihot esculenta]|uniref:Uncharacterized protein n=1 Tax=Manihot esculenta TaxID=3983 RepID=A0ACB7FYL6_MANES|nr:hypothetical protein MANES_18G074601v8 [Manihot esculenta]